MKALQLGQGRSEVERPNLVSFEVEFDEFGPGSRDVEIRDLVVLQVQVAKCFQGIGKGSDGELALSQIERLQHGQTFEGVDRAQGVERKVKIDDRRWILGKSKVRELIRLQVELLQCGEIRQEGKTVDLV